MHFFPSSAGLKFWIPDSLTVGPRTQASSSYPSYHRRLGTDCDFRHSTKWAHNIEGIQHSGQSTWWTRDIVGTRRSGKTWKVMALKTTVEPT